MASFSNEFSLLSLWFKFSLILSKGHSLNLLLGQLQGDPFFPAILFPSNEIYCFAKKNISVLSWNGAFCLWSLIPFFHFWQRNFFWNASILRFRLLWTNITLFLGLLVWSRLNDFVCGNIFLTKTWCHLISTPFFAPPKKLCWCWFFVCGVWIQFFFFYSTNS